MAGCSMLKDDEVQRTYPEAFDYELVSMQELVEMKQSDSLNAQVFVTEVLLKEDCPNDPCVLCFGDGIFLSEVKEPSDEIEGNVTKETLEVFNKLDKSIYYFAVERGTAATIFWAPISGEDNKIGRSKSRAIKLGDIYGFEPGKEILFYYWSEKEPESSDIKNIVIQS